MSEKRGSYKSPKAAIKSIVWNKTGGKCWYCGKQTNPFGKSNDVPCCAYCNRVKSAKGIDELRRFSVGEQLRFYFERELLRP